MWDLNLILSFFSLSLGALGIAVGIHQSNLRRKLERIRRIEILHAINRTKTMIITEEEAKQLTYNCDNPDLFSWVWKRYRGLSDLYVFLISNFISAHTKFDDLDVEKLCERKTIDNEWQKTMWMDQYYEIKTK